LGSDESACHLFVHSFTVNDEYVRNMSKSIFSKKNSRPFRRQNPASWFELRGS